jgi:hypothetical protein
MKTFVAGILGLFALAAVPVQAMPIAPLSGVESDITSVAGGCGAIEDPTGLSSEWVGRAGISESLLVAEWSQGLHLSAASQFRASRSFARRALPLDL